jgi:hypothetical protein
MPDESTDVSKSGLQLAAAEAVRRALEAQVEELLDQRRYSSAREERAAQPAPQSATQDDVIQLRGRCAALTAELKQLHNERCVLPAWKLNQQDKDVLIHSCAVRW